MAEGILRYKAASRDFDVEVDSCGTSEYHTGENPDHRAQANLASKGIDISSLRARQLNHSDFSRFDHILTMDESNYKDVLAICPPEARSKVKMILNYAEPGSNRPVPDPYFGGEDGFEHVFSLLDQACDKFLDEI